MIDTPTDDEIPEDAFQDEQPEAICPRSNQPVTHSMKAYAFIGFPNLICWKEVSGRQVTPEEYAEALTAYLEGVEPPILKGFHSQKTGKDFDAGLKLVSSEQEGDDVEESNWEFLFPAPVAPEESKFNCPKSGKPIQIRNKTFLFPGYPDVRFYRTINSREMSEEDFINVIESGEKGHFLRGFHSKKANCKFDAWLVLKEDKIEMVFNN